MSDTDNFFRAKATIKKADDGSFIAVASTNTEDRYGEIVDNNGWDLKSYKKNPVILWAHDHNEPAIGVSKKTWVEGTGKRAKLMIQPLLHDVTEKARAIKQLIDMGVINSLSVGYRILESPDGKTHSENELLEVSIANVPANPDARMLAYKSLKEADFKEETMQELGIETALLDKVEALEKTVNKLEERVNTPPAVNPSNETKIIRQRLSMTKVISRSADILLAAEKKDAPVERKQLYKSIKKAAEIIAVTEKSKL